MRSTDKLLISKMGLGANSLKLYKIVLNFEELLINHHRNIFLYLNNPKVWGGGGKADWWGRGNWSTRSPIVSCFYGSDGSALETK